jgi:hypothetical protein
MRIAIMIRDSAHIQVAPEIRRSAVCQGGETLNQSIHVGDRESSDSVKRFGYFHLELSRWEMGIEIDKKRGRRKFELPKFRHPSAVLVRKFQNSRVESVVLKLKGRC